MISSVAGFTVLKVRPEAESTASPLMISRPGETGARVSVIRSSPLGSLDSGAPTPAPDRLRMMPVVMMERFHHPAERMSGLPDRQRLLGHPREPLLEIAPRGIELGQRLVP